MELRQSKGFFPRKPKEFTYCSIHNKYGSQRIFKKKNPVLEKLKKPNVIVIAIRLKGAVRLLAVVIQK